MDLMRPRDIVSMELQNLITRKMPIHGGYVSELQHVYEVRLQETE